MKGVILAGGKGTRLYPVTKATCKQLLPIYDKPMIYYPLATLMCAGIQEILLISTEEDLPRFTRLLGTGHHLGLQISYQVQSSPGGIAQALILAEEFLEGDSVALILGDNIFYGERLMQTLRGCKELEHGAIIFGYEVKDPTRYGTLAFNTEGRVVDIIEKPAAPPSHYAVTGLYFYDNAAARIAKSLAPSARGELEITDVNTTYLRQGSLQVRLFDRGFAWLDTGTHEALQQAASYVQTIQERQGVKVGCIEEIAYQMGFIDEEGVMRLAQAESGSEYGAYLSRILSSVGSRI